MGKPCRLSFFAFKGEELGGLGYGEDVGPGVAFTRNDLLNGIDYCEGLIAYGFKNEPLDDFSLVGYIAWAKRTITNE